MIADLPTKSIATIVFEKHVIVLGLCENFSTIVLIWTCVMTLNLEIEEIQSFGVFISFTFQTIHIRLLNVF